MGCVEGRRDKVCISIGCCLSLFCLLVWEQFQFKRVCWLG